MQPICGHTCWNPFKCHRRAVAPETGFLFQPGRFPFPPPPLGAQTRAPPLPQTTGPKTGNRVKLNRVNFNADAAIFMLRAIWFEFFWFDVITFVKAPEHVTRADFGIIEKRQQIH